MTRQSLTSDIDALHQRLVERQPKLHLLSRRSKTVVRQLNPYWLVGAGLLTGGVFGSLGWRSAYATGLAGFKAYSLMNTGIAAFGGADDPG